MQKGRKSPSGAEFSMKFVAGPAEKALAEMAMAKSASKNDVLRDLISRAKVYGGNDYREAYRKFTAIGKTLAKAEDFNLVSGIAEYALKEAQAAKEKLWPEDHELEKENLDKQQSMIVNDGDGKGMTFRPKEQKAKLFALADSAGMTKPAALRALVLGIRLPNIQAMKTWGRASQIGALCKHLAIKARKKGWRKLYDIGQKMQEMAFEGAKLEKERRRILNDHGDRKAH